MYTYGVLSHIWQKNLVKQMDLRSLMFDEVITVVCNASSLKGLWLHDGTATACQDLLI